METFCYFDHMGQITFWCPKSSKTAKSTIFAQRSKNEQWHDLKMDFWEK